MISQNKLALLISLIKLGFSRKKLIIKGPKTKLNIKVLQILYDEGYIRGFRVKDYVIFVYLRINDKNPILNDIVYFSPKNKNNYISYKKLNVFFGFKYFVILTTNLGLLTVDKCLLYKQGGCLLLMVVH